MNLFDLHSDTLYEAYVNRLSPISARTLQAPLGISPFDKTHRLSAIWCSNELDDETCFREYLAIHAYTEDSVSHEGLPGGIGFSYAVEDARLLAGKLERMETLAAHNVKVLTLTWQGISMRERKCSKSFASGKESSGSGCAPRFCGLRYLPSK